MSAVRFMWSPYFIGPLVTFILSLCVWYFSPLIGGQSWRPFDGVLARSILVSVLWFLAGLVLLLIFLKRRKNERNMQEDIAQSSGNVSQGAAVEGEMGEVRDKLRKSMSLLRQTKGGRGQLLDLPWYVIIGPPGAGKTTAIVNSGLQFPLADEMGAGAIGGVGGTRNCDWWFTNDSVLIDTAGRYTTQESDAKADNAAWLGFLSLLKKHRKRQPINGAIIAISLSDLSLQDELTQMGHAKAVRRRLQELRERLGVRFPVYVLFTKADLIAGFSEYFDRLGKEERGQVWGFTFPLDNSESEASPMAAFDEEFSALLGQLNAQSLEKMQAETDPQRRSLISGFSSQVASVRPVARDFLNEVFPENAYEDRPMLRGVYFTSGTQEGTPIDRLMVNMAKTFGIGRQVIGSGRGTGRSYFLTRVFQDVMFPEAGLVSADDVVERRYRWTMRGAIAATVVLALVAGSMWTRSFVGNRALLADVEQSIGQYRTASSTIPGNPIGDTDLPGIVEALNLLRDVPGSRTATKVVDVSALKWGLFQGKVVANQASQTYRAALNVHMLPRLLLRLEEQMQGNINNPDLLYEALKIYLMLGLEGPMNAGLVSEWMEIDWSFAFPGPTREALRSDLTAHLNVLLEQPMQRIALNGPMIDQIQGILSEMPLAQRVYTGIITSPAAAALPAWRITDVGGPAVARAFIRSSGEPLSAGIDGIFTHRGFNSVFLREALGVATRIQSESWVLGPNGEAAQNQETLLAISRDVLDLYYNDYVAQYDAILGDIDIVPMDSLSHAVEVTNVLSGPTSPIVNILTAIAAETRLTEIRSTSAADDLSKIGEPAPVALDGQRQILFNALSSSVSGGEAPQTPGGYVEDRFVWLHNLVQRLDGQPSQLDQLLNALTMVYQELNKLSFSGVGNSESQVLAIVNFQQAASRVSGPLQRWSSQITTGSSGVAADGTRASINAKWQAQVLPFCSQATQNRYPIDRRAGADMALQDFQKLFGPDGMIDAFFGENLLKHVDTRTRPWTWKTVNEADLGISESVLQQMQFAAEIREAFFASGPDPIVKFQITPTALDPKARRVLLEIDGQEVLFSHRDGQPDPVAITWPGPVGLARVTFEPAPRNTESSLGKDGPWAWFRLLDSAEVRKTNVSDRKRVIFNVGGRISIFELQSGSVVNPFALAALSKFSCPKSF